MALERPSVGKWVLETAGQARSCAQARYFNVFLIFVAGTALESTLTAKPQRGKRYINHPPDQAQRGCYIRISYGIGNVLECTHEIYVSLHWVTVL